jgi:hypothetical protein
MIRVTIELVPSSGESPRVIGTGEIINLGSDDDGFTSNYGVLWRADGAYTGFLNVPGQSWETVVKKFKRRRTNVLFLIRESLIGLEPFIQ